MLGLLLLQVLVSCLCLGHSEVVTTFADCPQYFYKETTPSSALHPQNAAWICHIYDNQYRFATLYDKTWRIPVYSAYIYNPGNGSRFCHGLLSLSTTHIQMDILDGIFSFCFKHLHHVVPLMHLRHQQEDETNHIPKLIDKSYDKAMDTEESIKREYKISSDVIGKNQAIDQDYRNALMPVDRGHLSPTSHQNSNASRWATFTLTNIVPQNITLNQGAWRIYENKTMANKTKDCDTTYVITGAVPGNIYITDGRVNVPSHIWSAACCLKKKKGMSAWGAIAENNRNEVTNLNLGELERELSEIYRGTVTLFKNACPQE